MYNDHVHQKQQFMLKNYYIIIIVHSTFSTNVFYTFIDLIILSPC